LDYFVIGSISLAVKYGYISGQMGNSSRKFTRAREYTATEKLMKQLFKEFDRDADGFVTKEEFEETLHRLEIIPSPLEIDAMVAAADANNDCRISLKEFRSLVQSCPALASLIEAYKQFDSDGDGAISIHDVLRVMKELGQRVSSAEVRAMFMAADKDKDGVVCFEEFAQMMRARPLSLNVEDIFKTYDINSDGFITISELRQVCDKLDIEASDDELSTMLSVFDTSGDGKISYTEFQNLLIQGQKREV